MDHIRTIEWCSISRQAIPGVMLGMERPSSEPHIEFHRALTPSTDMAVAFFGDEPASDRLPCLAVIPDTKISEVLGWIHTFSPESFPLSQHCRILSGSDWERLAEFEGNNWTLNQRYRWASVVAGEMLAQAEASISPASVPLNWAQGCMSFAVARAAMIYGAGSVNPLVQTAQRLLALADNPSLQRKRVEPQTLSAIWQHVERTGTGFEGSSMEVAYAIVSEVNQELGHSLRSNSLLASSSAERRVQGFDQAADEAMSAQALPRERRLAKGAMLAGAAYLVGTGTSHIDLLEPYSHECPDAYVWLGLLAGIAGPKSWDPTWMRLVKGVDRLLNAGHVLTDAPQVDLSWVEFDWLSKLSGQVEEYAQLPKQNTRSLSVEMLPGVPCQFRLLGSPSAKGIEVVGSARRAHAPGGPAPVQAATGQRESGSSLQLDQVTTVLRLLTEAQVLLASGLKGQASLFDAERANGPPAKKRPANKKAQKASN